MKRPLAALLSVCLLVLAAAPGAIAAGSGKKPPPRAFTAGVEVEYDYAVVIGHIRNHGVPTGFRFKWGPTKAYGHITEVPEEWGYDGKHPVVVEEVIEPLKSDTTYHYCLIAYNRFGKTVGQDRTFHTPAN